MFRGLTHECQKKQSIMMRLAQHFNRFQSAAVYQIMQRSLTLLFPFVLIGSISQLIQLALFNRNSFVVNVFHLSNWLSKRNIFQMMFDSITSLTLGIVAALAAMCAARYTAKHYKRDEQLASITGLIAYLILALRLTPNEAYLSTARCWEWGAYFFWPISRLSDWISLQKKLGRPHRRDLPLNGSAVGRSLDSMWAILLVLGVILGLSVLLNWLAISILPDQVILRLQSLKANQTGLLFTLGTGLAATSLTFFWINEYANIGPIWA